MAILRLAISKNKLRIPHQRPFIYNCLYLKESLVDQPKMSKRAFLPHSREIQLPYSQYPCLSFPSFFYKTRNKIEGNRYITLIGLKIHVMRRFEQDQLLYLLQIFNGECPRVKIHVIPPNLIYAEVKIDSEENQDEIMDALQLQGRLFYLLQTAKQCFGEFINETMNEKYLLSTTFDSESFVNKFREEVVKKVKEREICIFAKQSHNKQ